MKKFIMSFMMVILAFLSACQQAPSDKIISSTLPPDSVAQSSNVSSNIKLETPIKSQYDSEYSFILKIDAQVYHGGYTSAPSYICLPMAFGDTLPAGKAFWGDKYNAEVIQHTEDRDTTGISWPYKAPLPWVEEYRLENVGILRFTHGLGTIAGKGDPGMDTASVPNIEQWQRTGDADGDGRASEMKRSREECLAQAQAFIDSLSLDMQLIRTDVLDVTAFQSYRFYFAHNYGGIPSSIGVNNLMRNYSWGQSLGEFMIIYVCDAGIYDVDAMLYDIVETKEAQPIISAQEATTKLIEAAQVYPMPVGHISDGFVIDSISLVYLPQAVEGDGVDVIGDERGGGLMRNMIPAWQFSTGYSYGRWSAMEMYIDARTGEYLQ